MGHRPDDSNSVCMKIKGVMTDPVSNMPVVILESEGESSYLPIWIGLCEANSIALEMEKVKTPRPMTHDLFLSLVSTLGTRVESVFIHTLSENVFFATIILLNRDDEVVGELDCRPSDALAIALRANAPVFVGLQVLEDAHTPDLLDEDDLKAVLEGLRPEDLGKYEM